MKRKKSETNKLTESRVVNIGILAKEVARANTPEKKQKVRKKIRTLIEKEKKLILLVYDPWRQDLPLAAEFSGRIKELELALACC